jgi:hypothetical protein
VPFQPLWEVDVNLRDLLSVPEVRHWYHWFSWYHYHLAVGVGFIAVVAKMALHHYFVSFFVVEDLLYSNLFTILESL